ncbi:MAG: acetate/propionate family kinase, partial [Oscillospiraceae bacterium]
RYGFHGTSHRYVSKRVAKLMNTTADKLKIVTCHLGNGSSISAVKNGKCIDTSMGFTPLGGIVMGTRSGDLDPSVICYLAEKENMSAPQMAEFLNKNSGILGLSQLTSDDRDLRAAEAEGNKLCRIAGQIQRYQIKKYVGAYAAAMGGIDALVFTGGIGENSVPLRNDVCADMEFLGISIDCEKNIVENNGKDTDLSAKNSRCKTWIVPTNEELTIARDTKEIVENL